MKKVAFMILLLPLVVHMYAQEKLINELTSYYSNMQSAENTENFEELVDQLYRAPLNVNSCTADELAQTSLFTAFQAYNIVSYRKKYGKFFDIYEMASIPGLNKEFLQLLAPLICFTGQSNTNNGGRLKSTLLSNFSIRAPLPGAYKESETGQSIYAGSPEKEVHRIKMSSGNITAGMTFEKDPGEKRISDKKPEHLVGYVAYTPHKILNNLIIGNFKLQNGLGLVHGSGFHTRGNGAQTNGFRNNYALPYASAMEYNYYRGGFVSLKTGSIVSNIYISSNPVDLSFFQFGKAPDLFSMERKTGYHRKKSEIDGIGLGSKFSTGMSVNLIRDQWNIGLSYAHENLSLTHKGLDSLTIMEYPKSVRSAFSIYGVAFTSSRELFFEAAMDMQRNHAFLGGFRLAVSPALSCYGSIRDYSIGFIGLMPSAYGASNQPRNSRGLNSGIRFVPFRFSSVNFDTDISIAKNAIESTASPGYQIMNFITFRFSKHTSTGIELRLKNYPADQTANLLQKERPGNSLQLKYFRELDAKVVFETKWIKNISERNHSGGQLVYQQFTFPLGDNFKCKYRFLTFNVPNWDDRIYLYEPGVRYSFLFPAWYGRGIQNLLTGNLNLPGIFTFRWKMAMNSYAHKHYTGSGDELRAGNRQYMIELQIQVDLN